MLVVVVACGCPTVNQILYETLRHARGLVNRLLTLLVLMLLLNAGVLLRFATLVTHVRILGLVGRAGAFVELYIVAVFGSLIRLGEIIYGTALVRRLADIVVVLVDQDRSRPTDHAGLLRVVRAACRVLGH